MQHFLKEPSFSKKEQRGWKMRPNNNQNDQIDFAPILKGTFLLYADALHVHFWHVTIISSTHVKKLVEHMVVIEPV